jgi:hypothetical protein
MMDDKILDDLYEEGLRLVDGAAEENVLCRLVGGMAIRVRCEPGLHPAFRREYHDIDLVTTGKRKRDLTAYLTKAGYEPNTRFNAVNGSTRLVFYDLPHERQLDVFVGGFEMCHLLPIAARIDLEPRTIPLAELLLMKLQIFKLNLKDLTDIWAVVYHHEVGGSDGDLVNGSYVAEVLAGDWGLWRTSLQTVEAAKDRLGEAALSDEERDLIRQRLSRLWEMVEAAPKGLRWRSRAKIGEKLRWYQLPEEIAHAVGNAP